MPDYTSEELSDAHRALLSTLHKCDKIDATKLGKSQQTLLKRRIAALKVALH
jgi:seryl-tRNA synthetase